MPTRFLSDAQGARYGCYTETPARDQLARYFHLDVADREIIGRLRGDHNRLGFALQLGTARFLGVLPTEFGTIPDAVVRMVAARLGLIDLPSLQAYGAGRPKKRHAAMIREVYGFREITDDAGARFRLIRWLYTLCRSGDDRPSLLVDRATAWMLSHKILLPGITTIERLVARVRDRAHRRLWQNLVNALSDEQRLKIDLLLNGTASSLQTLDELRKPPTKRMNSELLRHFRRIDDIRAYGLAPAEPGLVSNALVMRLARIARTMRPSAIAAASEPRRTAIVAALFHVLEAAALDDAVELFDALAADIFRTAKAARQRKRLRDLGDLDAAALVLRDLARHVMADDGEERELTFRAWREALYDELDRVIIADAIERIDVLAQPPDDRTHEELLRKWRTTQVLFRNLLARVEFGASPKGRPVKEALDYLSGIETWGKADMHDAPVGGLNSAWRKYALDTQGHVTDNKAYVFAVLEAWRSGIKTRDIFVPDGIRFGDPRQGLLAGKEWRTAKPTVCRTLERFPDGETEIAALATQLDQAYRRTARNFDTNPDARIEIRNGRAELVVTPLDRLDRPPSLLGLRA